MALRDGTASRGGGGGWARTLRRALTHPLTFPVWAFMAAWSLLTLKQQRIDADLSVASVGTLADRIMGANLAGEGVRASWSYDLYGVEGEGAGGAGGVRGAGGAWRVIDTNPDSADELTRLWQDSPERIVQVVVVLEDEFAGAVAFTNRRMRDRMTLAPFTERTLTPQQRGEIRRASVDHMLLVYPGAELDADIAERIARLRGGDTDRERRLWIGYAVDAGLPVGAVMATLAGLRGLLAFSALSRRPRGWWRRRHGRCAGCDYPLAGIAGDHCPECGAPITPAGGAAKR